MALTPIADPNTWFLGLVTPAMLKSQLTDPVNAVIATLGDSGWQNLSAGVPSSFTVVSAKVRSVGPSVVLLATFQRATGAGTWANDGMWTHSICTVPTAMQPTIPVPPFPGAAGVAGGLPQFSVNTDGTVDVRNYGSVAIPAGTQINCVQSWFIG